MARELTREEKAAIRKLVTRLCANYDRDVGCLPLDCPCYMLEKCWTGALCHYFREAVLPNDPVLEASLAAEGPARKPGPARYAAGPFSRMAGHGIVPPAAPRPQGSKSSGAICGNTGGNALAFGPGKPACHKAFRGRFGRGQYLFPSAPVLRK